MATSLAEQLKKLRTPQTTLLLQDKRKPSLLFDTKEAANLDKDTVYNIGLSGLEELIKLNNAFDDFKKTLFALSSISLERSVQDNKMNQKLNTEIEKFLVLLSPYFLLNTAHKALEWLIHRFHVHQFNKDHYLLLILPYHESRIFVRALQLLDLSDPRDKWHWLKPIQKSRSPLSSMSLVNQAVSDNGFLKTICDHVIYATKMYSDKADSLNTLYAFYTTITVGRIEHSHTITDVQFNHMLPALLKGLSCQTPDYAASSFMIFSKLISKIHIQEETIDLLLLKSIKKPILTREVVLLILFLYDNPFNTLNIISESFMIRLSKRLWFIEVIEKVKNSGVKVSKFIILLLNTALNFIAHNEKSEDTEEVKQLVDEIFRQISFKEEDVLSILQSTMSNDVISIKNSDAVQSYFINLYQSVEKKYPESFDKYLHELMHMKESSENTNSILKFLMLWYSKAEESLDIFTGLNHHNPEHRIIAIKMIGKKNISIPENLQEIVNKSLLSRFHDDDDRVIKALLNLPLNLLQNTFAVDTLVDELIILVSRCHAENKKDLAKSALKVLLSFCDESDDISVFLVTVPYLFPTRDEDVGIAMQILKSDFAKRNAYFKRVAVELGEAKDAESVRSVAFHNILISELLPQAANILNAIKQQMAHGDAASVFFNMIILGSVCRVPVGSLKTQIAGQAIEMAAEMMNKFPSILPLNGATHINADKLFDALKYIYKGQLPLQVNTYVLEMVHRRLNLNNNSKLDFEEDFERSQLILRVLEIVFDGMVLDKWRKNYSQMKSHYDWYLKIFFQRHFKTVEDVIKFLSQFFIKPVKVQTSLHCLHICLVLFDDCKSFQWIFNDRNFVINLLLTLSSENNTCREVGVAILKKLSQTFNISMEGFSVLLLELADRSTEISLDHNQLSLLLYTLLSPDPDVSHQLKADVRPKLENARELLFEATLSNDIAIHIRSQLLDILTYVNSPKILKRLVPLGSELLENANIEEKIFAQNAMRNVIQRFDTSSVTALKNKTVWNFFIKCATTHDVKISMENTKQYVSVILIKQIDNRFFSKLDKSAQKELIGKFIDVVTDFDIDAVISTITKLIKKISIDAQLVVDELKTMTTVKNDDVNKTKEPMRKSRSMRISYQYNPEMVNSRKWRRGVTLLEFIQHSNNIENEELLVPVLFDLLKTSLCFEEQSPVEYTNQLVLSTIYHLAIKNIIIKNADAYVDLIAQCIRTSQNPQTHHHALLVLVELFKLADIQQAIQNIMPIFTFMGSTVLRQDDAYSIQIISKTIDTIIPIINSTKNIDHVCEILRLFITSLPDIPEHRRSPLFLKLLQLLDNYLHLYYLLTFESHVLSKRFDNSEELSSDRLRFALSISQNFSVKKIIRICIKLVEFLKELPIDIQEGQKNIDFKSNNIFDVANNSPKQLRHYKYTIVKFLVALLSNSEFINQVAELSDNDLYSLKPLYDKLIVELLFYIQSTSKVADHHQGKPNVKYWKVVLHGLYDIVDLINNLLPNSIFIASIINLVHHKSLTVRRKALDLLNARFIQKKFSEEDHQDLLNLIGPITNLLQGPHKFANPELEVVQQTALITLKLLAKLLASQNPYIFKPILELTTELIKKREGAVLGSATLCVAELCSSMRVHAIESLNKFVPAIIRLLQTYCKEETPDILTISIISALQKIVESVGNFLSLYLVRLLYELARLNTLYTDLENPKISPIVLRLKAITQKLTSCIPVRVLLPAVNKTYDTLLSSKSYQSISPLLDIFAESFNNIQSSELNNIIPEIGSFFLKTLQFREEVTISHGDMEIDGEATIKDVANIEESASKALVTLVLRLNEATFRPLYYKLYDWVARNSQHKERNITFYRLSANIAEGLKSLFVLFAGHFLKHAASLLIGNNIKSCEGGSLETTLQNEAGRIELIEEILLTLYRVFTYDARDFVNQERFDTLMQPIVDQIENTIGTDQQYEKRANELIVPCIAAFVGSIPDDSLHKQLVYQILLKTKNEEPRVRNTALNAIVEIARKLGEDYQAMLPETAEFFFELLEDEEEFIQKNTRNAVRTLEEILGQPVQKYF
ncbi:HEAT repeat-containing protein 1 homolog [Phymastichus coffea]|uniref:HEAT repeat-containing protein 1 homolog n=1 Tax=Phymastichus coffea TaxID=108790 RepID=UPI00273C2BC6|nr:HEAT repeat-containing protein 1 homolog [Phymastichus coffea]